MATAKGWGNDPVYAPKVPPSTSLGGMAASASRGVGPYAAGALAGGALAAPTGVGIPVGAAAGVGAVGLAQLTEMLYNPLAEKMGWPKAATPQEMTDKVFDFVGVRRPSTGVERTVEAAAGGAAGGFSTTLAAKTLEPVASGLSKLILGQLGQRPVMQAASGASSGVAANTTAELGGGPIAQTAAGLAGGLAPAAIPRKVSPSIRADRRIEDAMNLSVKSGEVSPQEVVDALRTAHGFGKPATIGDAGGGEARALLGSLARRPGESRAIIRKFLEDRDAKAGARTEADVAQGLGIGPTARRTEQGLRQVQSLEGNPLYEKAFEGGSVAPLKTQFENAWDAASRAEQEAMSALTSANARLTAAQARGTQTSGNAYSESGAREGIREAQSAVSDANRALTAARDNKQMTLDAMREAQADLASGKRGGIWNPQIQILLDNAEVKKGIARGVRIQKNEADAAGRKFDPTEYAITGYDPSGDPVVSKVPNMRLLNAAKKGLDAIIADNRIDGRLNELGRSVDMLRKTLLRELDTASPDYSTARAKWAGDNASIDALKIGKNITRMTPEEVADAVSGMAASDKEFLRIGVADNILERIAKTPRGADESKRMITNEWAKGQLKPVFESEEALARFVKSVEIERNMYDTKQSVFGGSQTAGRVAQDSTAAAGGHAAHGIAHALTGNKLASVLSAMRARNAWGLRPSPETDALTARRLTDPNTVPTEGPKGLAMHPSGILASDLAPRRSFPWFGLPAGALAATQAQQERR
jgi:hypothetical protein